MKSSSIFELKKQLHVADPNIIPDFLGQIKLHYDEHKESPEMQQVKLWMFVTSTIDSIMKVKWLQRCNHFPSLCEFLKFPKLNLNKRLSRCLILQFQIYASTLTIQLKDCTFFLLSLIMLRQSHCERRPSTNVITRQPTPLTIEQGPVIPDLDFSINDVSFNFINTSSQL